MSCAAHAAYDTDRVCKQSAKYCCACKAHWVSHCPRRYSVFAALYAYDGNHPSEAGTYLESSVVAATISGAARP